MITNLFNKVANYVDVLAKLTAANERIRQLETQNAFLMKTLEDAALIENLQPDEQVQISNLKKEINAEKTAKTLLEIEDLKQELEFMETLPVAGRLNMLERDRAVRAHRTRINELELDLRSDY